MAPMTLNDFIESTQIDSEPPDELSEELRSLWFAKKGKWHDSHDIAQDIHTPMGSWIHALLHTIEGDLGNAGYWYSKAGKPAIQPDETDDEWARISETALESV